MEVAIRKCKHYAYKEIELALDQVFVDLGGLDKFIKPGQKVLIKPNLVMGKAPEVCATTHPLFVEIIAKKVIELGAVPTIADSPGGLYTPAALKRVYHLCQMTEAAKKSSAKLNFDVTWQEVKNPNGKAAKQFMIINPILEADVIINVCKIKTHGMTLYTGAVKNLFGSIPGTAKVEYHYRLPEKKDFCEMLVDLCELVKPTLSVMDAVYGMEGAGPTGGSPRKLGLVLASENPFAIDLIGCELIGYQSHEIFTVKHAIDRGLCPKTAGEVTIIGENYKDYQTDFEKPASREIDFLDNFPKSIRDMAKKLIRPYPKFIHETCVGCGECARCCPAKVITMKGKKPYVKLKGCIRCFCCQELCPAKAVEIKRAKIMSILTKKGKE